MPSEVSVALAALHADYKFMLSLHLVVAFIRVCRAICDPSVTSVRKYAFRQPPTGQALQHRSRIPRGSEAKSAKDHDNAHQYHEHDLAKDSKSISAESYSRGSHCHRLRFARPTVTVAESGCSLSAGCSPFSLQILVPPVE
jgi:hypothetical protein